MAENAPAVRARIYYALVFLGIELEKKRNVANEGLISVPAGQVVLDLG
jgi:acetate kinase